ncbi:hypothetical protein OCU04_011392 [Sclerotinia nivalis]|uniref:Uncharacterized protein n=1 Tax=Sclerotinia nivalis TaxID=352851 RepID=A0A9X0ABL4_9HELO|nr:hypothetical protein OCU04_011392 [Sclerotinia nivalis]
MQCSIGDYNRIQDCSFCALISKAISLAWGINGSSGGVHHSPLNTAHRLFMQSRSPLVLKVNGQMKYPAPRILLAIDQQPPSHQDNRPTLREIDRSENRFIFAEIEQLLDDSDDFIRRRAVPKSLNTPLLQKWLFNCENHQHSKALIQRRTKSLLFNRETPFRLVDVVQECLTLQVEWCKYIALSYT